MKTTFESQKEIETYHHCKPIKQKPLPIQQGLIYYENWGIYRGKMLVKIPINRINKGFFL